MTSHDHPAAAHSATTDLITAAGVDHVRLVYDYLDAGDADSCASLMHERVVLELPGMPPVHGRAEAVRAHLRHSTGRTRHEIDHLVAADRSVVAAGRRVVPDSRHPCTRFVDVFRIADDGMVSECTRYYHTTP
ncbi:MULTISPECIES: nuclear transport factor 2 family protein [Streptomyces]|uniref:Nuclear transport factor 2 family protein n=1 Tax=Streptomyces chilikensis TaxID=1194079 RepID=A0ABV3ELW9_9ACTN|nr:MULTISPECIES: nuclear transport factor 2 family protein [Streptomyces]MDH6223558.1 ketosteroid isomerase-like protein [Streptomyces sp. MJP52]